MDVISGDLPIQAIIRWDVENWSRTLDFWHSKTKLDLRFCHALDIGTGNGGLSLFLALKGASVVCSDVNGPSDQAKALHEQYGVSERITYATADARSIPFADGSLDLVVFKSVMGGLSTYPNQKRMVEEIYRVLRFGGEFWFAENLVATLVHRIGRKWVLRRKCWRYVTISEIDELCRSFGKVYLKPYGFLAAFGRTNSQRKVLGKIDRITNRCIPSGWRYIAFVVAQK